LTGDAQNVGGGAAYEKSLDQFILEGKDQFVIELVGVASSCAACG
jgi:hypothetical protein